MSILSTLVTPSPVEVEDGIVFVLLQDVEYDGGTVLGVFSTMALAMSWCDRNFPPKSAAKKWAWSASDESAYRRAEYGYTYDVQAHNLNRPES
jgi:hypothetical protein